MRIKFRCQNKIEHVIATRASCYQNFDARWIDEYVLLVASSDIGFFSIDVSHDFVLLRTEVCRNGNVYVVKLLDENGRLVRKLKVDRNGMPDTPLLKYVSEGE